jgi:hypothetical protein
MYQEKSANPGIKNAQNTDLEKNLLSGKFELQSVSATKVM